MQFYYEIDEKENTAEITRYGANEDDIVIPSTIVHESKNYLVTSISPSAFFMQPLVSVRFASDSKLRIIGEESFSRTSIESITFPTSLNKISPFAFSNCEKLREINFPEDCELEIIDDLAFSKTLIESVSIPSNLKEIGIGAFSDCKQLKEIKIPSNSQLRKIEREAFYGTLIEEITIPPNLIELCNEWGNGTDK